MITLNQIRRELRLGKQKWVYYSTGSLWWTHLKSDLIDSSLKGRKYIEEQIKITEGEEKQKLIQVRQDLKSGLPIDPIGYPVKRMELKKWLSQSLSNPSHFGKYGLNAFVFTHHQNCKMFFSNKWDSYNNYIDKLKTRK
jgi:hypothetical protein